MFGLNDSKTVTASYEDAVKFVDGMMKKQFEELDDHAKSGSAQGLTVFPGERVKRRAPEVLGADGLPLDEDDTVYGTVREQHRYTVQVPYSINEAVGQRFCVQCYDHDEGNITWCDPSMLTHTPPDTLERLRDDMYRTAEEWREADSVSIPDMNHWADRLAALIERKGGE